MKIRSLSRILAFVVMTSVGSLVHADIIFSTKSNAVQTLTGPALNGGNPVILHSTGIQTFTFNTATNSANVTSNFLGSDLPDPAGSGQNVTYMLYNTATTGTLIQNVSGTYIINFSLLFELKVTSGGAAGLIIETKDPAIFQATDVANIPFTSPVRFANPGSGSDSVNLYIKYDPTGTYQPGTFVGTSSQRMVTTPEPTSLILTAIGIVGMTLTMSRMRRAG